MFTINYDTRRSMLLIHFQAPHTHLPRMYSRRRVRDDPLVQEDRNADVSRGRVDGVVRAAAAAARGPLLMDRYS